MPSETDISASSLASYAYNIFPLGWLPLATELPDKPTTAAGEGAANRFRRPPEGMLEVEAAEASGELVAGVEPSSCPEDRGMLPDNDLVALAAYPEERLFIVFCLVRVGPELRPFEGGVAVASKAAACRSALIFFFSSLVCSPGQSAGTFMWHLL